MPLQAEYKGMRLIVTDNDSEYLEFFQRLKQHKLSLRKCKQCGLMRYPPGGGCPWCSSLEWEWADVSGKGYIYSYFIVTQAINPAFQDWIPYPVALIELDEQRGVPTQDEAIRIITNIVDDNFQPVKEEQVAIGKRVQAVFHDVNDELTLLQFKLTDEPPVEPLWQIPG